MARAIKPLLFAAVLLAMTVPVHGIVAQRRGEGARGTPAPPVAVDPSKDRDLLQRAIVAGMRPRVDTAALDDALEALRSGRVRLAEEDRDLEITFPPGSITRAAEMLWTGYMRAREDESTPSGTQEKIRELLILLCGQGLNTDYTFEKGQHSMGNTLAGTPLGVLFRDMTDPPFVDAFLDSGSPLHGTVVQAGPRPGDDNSGATTAGLSSTSTHALGAEEEKRQSIVGLSLLHLLANSGIEINVIREFYKLERAYRRAFQAEVPSKERQAELFDKLLHKTYLWKLMPCVACARGGKQQQRR